MHEEDLFHEALAKPPAERGAFLDAACAGQPELRAGVEALLEAHAASGPFLDVPIGAAAETGEHTPASGDRRGTGTAEFESGPCAGAVIAGRYTLVQKIGEGGMGEVWVAKQTEPVKRRVALKLIKPGMDSKSVLARFEAERQALALMDHPNIAKVLDGGLTQDRRPFFVMELVNGLPLSKFCDDAKLGIRERLELFVPVCQAVQHAHQKGIVHRDLKPSNILVTLYDGKPVPKVIDFGVAKATGGKLTDDSLSTQFGSVVGTLEYMAPEQAGFSAIDVDTRADIYSLGVVLYELLTGLRPFESRRLKEAALDEIIRILREEEPSKPSKRLSTAEASPSLAALRGTEPARLARLLRGELDWVVMKCLDKQRDRRYETANALGRDIQRYLADEAVEARPPSAGYRLRKFVKRNKGRVLAATVVLVALIGGIVGTAWGLARAVEAERQARADQKQAEGDRDDKEAARRKEAAARLEANEQEQIAEAVNRFMLEDVLGKADAQSQEKAGFRPVPNLTVRQAVERAASQVGERFKDRPAVEAAVRLAIGGALNRMDEDAKAIVHLERARKLYEQLGTLDSERGIRCLVSLAESYLMEERRTEALKTHEQLHAHFNAKFGPDHPKTLIGIAEMAHCAHETERTREAIKVIEGALGRLKAQPSPKVQDINSCMTTLASLYFLDQQFDKALELEREVLAFALKHHGKEATETFSARVNLAVSLQLQGEHAHAALEYAEAWRISKSHNGENAPLTLQNQADYGRALVSARQHDEGLKVLTDALERAEKNLGRLHPTTVRVLSTLATSEAKGTEAFIQREEDVYSRYKEKFGAGSDPSHLHAQNLVKLYQHTKQHDKAVHLLDEVYKATEAERGPTHRRTVTVLGELVEAYGIARRMNEGAPLAQAYIERGGKEIWPVQYLGVHLLNTGEPEQAIPHLEKLLAHARALPKAPPRKLHHALQLLAEAHFRAKHPDQALPLFGELQDLVRKAFVPGSAAEADARRSLGQMLLRASKPDDAMVEFEASRDLYVQLAMALPDELAYREALAEMCPQLSKYYREQRKPKEALAQLLTAQQALERLLVADPKNVRHLRRLAGVLTDQGMIYLGTFKLAREAEAANEQASKLYRALRGQLPDDPWIGIHLGGSHCNIGNALSKQGKNDEAIEQLSKAIDVLSTLHTKDPKEETIRQQFLLNSHRLRGEVYKRIKSYPEAVADWDKAVELGKDPNQRLHFLTMRALCRARTDSALALKEAEALLKTKGASGPLLYNVACVYAVVLSRSTDNAERERLALETLQTLREARRLGYFENKAYLELFKTDSDFDALRDRDDFRKFLAELGIAPAGKTEERPPLTRRQASD